jgi:hypothetical protein
MDVFSKKSETYFFDSGYSDFFVNSCLRNGNKVLRNFFIESPPGLVYNLDGVEVIKYDIKKAG